MADNLLNYKNSYPKPLFQLSKILNCVCDLNTLFLVNSCNGLLYFCQNRPNDCRSLVCNPVTSEYIIIPDLDPKMRLVSRSLWLGFSPGTEQYKLLRIFRRNDSPLTEVAAQVFVIGSDSWRDIDDTPLFRVDRRYFAWEFSPTDVNGLMYWHYGMSCPGLIISFDFEREKFGELALPPEFQEKAFMTKQHVTSIGVLGGCLCLSCNSFNAHRVDLWVMRKYGNRDSWTKDFVFYTEEPRGLPLNGHGKPVNGQFKPLQFLENGEILMQLRNRRLVCYDPRTKTLRYFRLDRYDLSRKVVALTPSFVPLKDALKVEEVSSQLRPRGDEEEP